MDLRRCPAAYVLLGSGGDSTGLAHAARAVSERASQRGWPDSQLYVDHAPGTSEPGGPALARLLAAVLQGRHACVLITGTLAHLRPGTHLTPLLRACTSQGVQVEFVPPRPRQQPRHPRATTGALEHQPVTPDLTSSALLPCCPVAARGHATAHRHSSLLARTRTGAPLGGRQHHPFGV